MGVNNKVICTFLFLLVIPAVFSILDMSNPDLSQANKGQVIVRYEYDMSGDSCGPNSHKGSGYQRGKCVCDGYMTVNGYGCEYPKQQNQEPIQTVGNDYIDYSDDSYADPYYDDSEYPYDYSNEEPQYGPNLHDDLETDYVYDDDYIETDYVEEGCGQNMYPTAPGRCECYPGYYQPKGQNYCRKIYCGVHGTLNGNTCSCEKGYELHDVAVGCEQIACIKNAHFDDKTGECECYARYIYYDEKCQDPKKIKCPSKSKFNLQAMRCVCDDGYFFNEDKHKCERPDEEVYNQKRITDEEVPIVQTRRIGDEAYLLSKETYENMLRLMKKNNVPSNEEKPIADKKEAMKVLNATKSSLTEEQKKDIEETRKNMMSNVADSMMRDYGFSEDDFKDLTLEHKKAKIARSFRIPLEEIDQLSLEEIDKKTRQIYEDPDSLPVFPIEDKTLVLLNLKKGEVAFQEKENERAAAKKAKEKLKEQKSWLEENIEDAEEIVGAYDKLLAFTGEAGVELPKEDKEKLQKISEQMTSLIGDVKFAEAMMKGDIKEMSAYAEGKLKDMSKDPRFTHLVKNNLKNIDALKTTLGKFENVLKGDLQAISDDLEPLLEEYEKKYKGTELGELITKTLNTKELSNKITKKVTEYSKKLKTAYENAEKVKGVLDEIGRVKRIARGPASDSVIAIKGVSHGTSMVCKKIAKQMEEKGGVYGKVAGMALDTAGDVVLIPAQMVDATLGVASKVKDLDMGENIYRGTDMESFLKTNGNEEFEMESDDKTVKGRVYTIEYTDRKGKQKQITYKDNEMRYVKFHSGDDEFIVPMRDGKIYGDVIYKAEYGTWGWSADKMQMYSATDPPVLLGSKRIE